MRCVYFDVNLFRHLFLRDGKHTHCVPHLHQLVHSNRLRVFGSAMQFEELFGIARVNAEAFGEMSAGAANLIGRYFLRDRAKLFDLELQRRKQLSHAEACVSASELAQVHTLIQDLPAGHEVNREVRQKSEEYRADFSDRTDEIMGKLSTMGVDRRTLRTHLTKN